MYIITRATKSQ